MQRSPESVLGGFHIVTGPGSALKDQRRSMLFFRTVPLLFAEVWIILLVLTSILLA